MTATRKPRTPKTATTTESSTDTTPAKPGRGRRKATGTQETAPVFRSEQELALVAKYTHQRVVPGSWRAAGGREGLGAKKATVIVTCVVCDVERILCTSDLQWTTTCYCLRCVKDVKANQRRTKTEKKAQ